MKKHGTRAFLIIAMILTGVAGVVHLSQDEYGWSLATGLAFAYFGRELHSTFKK